MITLIFRMLLLVMLCVGGASAAFSASVTSTFQLAHRAFERGDYVSAARILQVILKKYPDHQASTFLMGRTLYRMGKTKLALPYFRKSGDFIAADGAFEYGIAFFSAGNCSRAIQGFAAVPRGNAYRDLAQFYSGVCLYRARRYDAADKMLRRARVLPNNLASTKRDLLTFIERQQMAERNGRMSSSPSFAPIPLPSYAFPSYGPPQVYQPPPDRPPTPGKKSRDEKPAAPPPAVAGTATGFSTTTTPSVTVIRRGTQIGKGQGTVGESSEQGLVAGMDSRSRYDFSGKNQPAMLLGAKLDVSNKNFKTSEIRYIVYEDDPTGAVVPQEVDKKDMNVKSWTVTLTPGVNIPFSSSASLEANVVYWQINPDYKMSNKRTYLGPLARMSLMLDPVSLSLMVSNLGYKNVGGVDGGRDTRIEGSATLTMGDYKLIGSITRVQTTDAKGAAIGDRLYGFDNRMLLSGSAKRSWDSFSLTVTGTQFTQTPPPDANVTGIHDELRLEGTVEKTFAFGASVLATGLYTKLNGYIKDGIESTTLDDAGKPVKGAASAHGGRKGFIVTGKLTPIEWGFLSASYSMYTSDFIVEQPEYAASFAQNVTDFTAEYVINIGVTKSF